MNKEETIEFILSQDKSTFDTRQQFFDYAMCHLYKQEVSSSSKDVSVGMCCYSIEGKSCAIGCLLTKEEYNSGMEGLSFGSLYRGIRLREATKNLSETSQVCQSIDKAKLSLFPERLQKIGNIDFFACLQRFHDNPTFAKGKSFKSLIFKRPAKLLAAKFGLDSSIVSTLWKD
jgi:hypothetical protein